jgi:hypothetical protein
VSGPGLKANSLRGCLCHIFSVRIGAHSAVVLPRARHFGVAAGDLLLLCFPLGRVGCSNTMGSCCSCLNRDSVPDNHPTKFKVSRAPSSLEFPKKQAEVMGLLRLSALTASQGPEEKRPRPLLFFAFLDTTKNKGVL